MPAGVTLKRLRTTLLPWVEKAVKAVKQSLWWVNSNTSSAIAFN
jgi:hypothetical protein